MLVTRLNHLRKMQGDALDTYFPAAKAGPVLPIPVVLLGSLRALDGDLHDLAYEITRGAKVIDRAEPATKLNSSNAGAMRSWHQNDKKMLPAQDITDSADGLSGKALAYHNYVKDTKGLMNKQRLKGVAPRYTGYVEFTACGWEGAHVHGRFVYDYQRNRLFLTPSHYVPMKVEGRELKTSSTDADEGYQSPFFYIE